MLYNIIKVYVLYSYILCLFSSLGVETMFADLGHFSSLSIKVRPLTL